MTLSLALLSLLFLAAIPQQEVQQSQARPGSDLPAACLSEMKNAPLEGNEACREFSASGQVGDPSQLQTIKDWLAEYEKLQPYFQSLKALPSDPNGAWLLHQPDMFVSLPDTSETQGQFKTEISRKFYGPKEELLLREAEAVYPGAKNGAGKYLVAEDLCKQDRGSQAGPVWGVCGNDNIEATSIVTARAVRYYYDLTLLERKNPSLPSGFTALQSEMKYDASIEFFADYSHKGDTFHGVYVADLTLKWGFGCGTLCGVGFTRNKVVVLDPEGHILALYLDADVNNTTWVS